MSQIFRLLGWSWGKEKNPGGIKSDHLCPSRLEPPGSTLGHQMSYRHECLMATPWLSDNKIQVLWAISCLCLHIATLWCHSKPIQASASLIFNQNPDRHPNNEKFISLGHEPERQYQVQEMFKLFRKHV